LTTGSILYNFLA